MKHTLRALQAAGRHHDPDEAADGADRGRGRAQSARAQREAAGGGTAGQTQADADHDGRIVRIRDQEGRPQQPDRPRGRSRAAPRDVAVGRRSACSSSPCCCSRRGSTSSCCATAIGSSRCSRSAPSEDEINRHLRLEIETLRSPARIERLATGRLRMVAPGPGRRVGDRARDSDAAAAAVGRRAALSDGYGGPRGRPARHRLAHDAEAPARRRRRRRCCCGRWRSRRGSSTCRSFSTPS